MGMFDAGKGDAMSRLGPFAGLPRTSASLSDFVRPYRCPRIDNAARDGVPECRLQAI
ncbi:hypothetical protein [Streptomyces sp. NPDC052114]|uniref:hypothetical protein n=1 Tax=unclassified Streptomyces TaxID=2593676 RepID=UPI00343AA944